MRLPSLQLQYRACPRKCGRQLTRRPCPCARCRSRCFRWKSFLRHSRTRGGKGPAMPMRQWRRPQERVWMLRRQKAETAKRRSWRSTHSTPPLILQALARCRPEEAAPAWTAEMGEGGGKAGDEDGRRLLRCLPPPGCRFLEWNQGLPFLRRLRHPRRCVRGEQQCHVAVVMALQLPHTPKIRVEQGRVTKGRVRTGGCWTSSEVS